MKYTPSSSPSTTLHEPLAAYSRQSGEDFRQLLLFASETVDTSAGDIRVVELFAGVGGFRVGLERASDRFRTVWSNQWEPSTKRQDASIVYCQQFGAAGHSNHDIATVPTADIPAHDLLVGGFPCQDYSVATTLKRSGGIEGKKGVLWWQIYRIIEESADRPAYLLFENVDRLLRSPANQRGRDFAIILASLADLGYVVEWRVINAAEYGMPQRRRRTYIMAYRADGPMAARIGSPTEWVLETGVMARAFPAEPKAGARVNTFAIDGRLDEVSANFAGDFDNAGLMVGRQVTTLPTVPIYNGPCITLGQILQPDREVDASFFVDDEQLPKWQYLKGGKKEVRTTAGGFAYNYSEGAMAFPDSLDKPSRTIITGEGGAGPSRFKHVVCTPSGRYRRLTPIELERLNMFPDRHTEGVSDSRRAFLMGNALVTGIVERIGRVIESEARG
ncbi:MAG: DNA (cytosine-5-)-methyltransferase [Bacteroidaceae bacterium]|nr:DNA (cytosine-5-)-methyltransferase [Bacteroidaceae bacterium]